MPVQLSVASDPAAITACPRPPRRFIGLRIAAACAGVAVFAFALLDPLFRRSDGFPSGFFCLPLSVGVALLTIAATAAGRFMRAGLWFAVAIAGQAAALQLIDAGQSIHFQHYRIPEIRRIAPSLAIIALQFSLVTPRVPALCRTVGRWLAAFCGPWRAVLGIGALILATVAPSRHAADFAAEFAVAGFLELLNLATITLAAFALPPITASARAMNSLAWIERRSLALVIFCAFVVSGIAATLSYSVYQNHPHVPDECSYLYQAKLIAAGRLTAPAPPVADAFTIYLIEQSGGRIYGTPPVGWPALLAAGVLFGVPWLVNPILAGINVLLGWIIMRNLFTGRATLLCVLLFALSPWNLFLAMSFMTHTATLTCALGGACAVIRAKRTGRVSWGFLAGVASGYASLIRPLDGVIVAAVLVVAALIARVRFTALAGFAACTVLVAGAVFPYNRFLTGHSAIFPLNAYLDSHFGAGRNAIGFGANRGLDFGGLDPFPGHGPLDAVINAYINTFSLNTELHGWACGSLLLVFVAVFLGKMGMRDYGMAAIVVMIVACFSLYWYSGGPDFGARYWYLGVFPLIALSARGACLLERHSAAGGRVLITTAVLCLIAAVNYLPWRAFDKYYHYLHMQPGIRDLTVRHHFREALVLVRGPEHPDYASAWIYNPITFNGPDPLFAWDKDPATRKRLLEAFPNRPVWTVEGPSVTHDGFRVLRGPLLAAELLREMKRR